MSLGVARSGLAMETLSQASAYQCDKCETQNIVAVFDSCTNKGTRTLFRNIQWSRSEPIQRLRHEQVAPPNRVEGIFGPVVGYGGSRLSFLWHSGLDSQVIISMTIARFQRRRQQPRSAIALSSLLLLAFACSMGFDPHSFRPKLPATTEMSIHDFHWGWELILLCLPSLRQSSNSFRPNSLRPNVLN